MPTKFISALILAIASALLVGYLFGHQDDAPQTTTTPRCTSPLEGAEFLDPYRLGGERQENVEMHVSYNSLTGGHSKAIYRRGVVTLYVLQGEKGGHILRCAVSKEFFDATEENSFVTLPVDRCEEVKP